MEARSCGSTCPCPENRSGPFLPHESNPQDVSVRCIRTALGGLRDPPRPNAGGAYAHVLADAVHHRTYPPQIRIPAAAAGVIGVADDVAVVRHFAANLAFLRHTPPSINLSNLWEKFNRVFPPPHPNCRPGCVKRLSVEFGLRSVSSGLVIARARLGGRRHRYDRAAQSKTVSFSDSWAAGRTAIVSSGHDRRGALSLVDSRIYFISSATLAN
jgi:hypothetical protein